MITLYSITVQYCNLYETGSERRFNGLNMRPAGNPTSPHGIGTNPTEPAVRRRDRGLRRFLTNVVLRSHWAPARPARPLRAGHGAGGARVRGVRATGVRVARWTVAGGGELSHALGAYPRGHMDCTPEPNYTATSILLTGGCGFIGPWVARALRQAYPAAPIVVLDKRDYCSSLGGWHTLLLCPPSSACVPCYC